MRNNPLVFAALLAAAVISCRREAELPVNPPARYASIPVSMEQFPEETGSRSLVSIDVENFQQAALFAFDPDSGKILVYEDSAGDDAGKPVVVHTAQKSFFWALPLDTPMDIYAIVNYGTLDLDSFMRTGLDRTELEALRFISSGPSELKKLETEGQGLPMAGIKEGVTLTGSGENLSVRVKKLYAKYNIYFDLAKVLAEGWHIQAMHMIVENANTEVPYFTEGFRQDDAAKLVEYDRATDEDLDELQLGGNGHAVTLYTLENCQGHQEGAESWKTVYKDLGFEALQNCTYIDLSVKVRRESGEYQNLGYAIYLGKTDMRSDFDIERNMFKTIKVVLPGPSELIPASTFFKFSGTDSPTVSPGETLDLYFVTNLSEEDIAVSCDPDGFLSAVSVSYEAVEDGIATGYIRFLASEDLDEGTACVVTAGSESLSATDQKTVTASWPTVLEVDTSFAPVYVAQAGYLRIIPEEGVLRTDAEVKTGSESILKVGDAGVNGTIFQIGVSGLSVGTGTVILHHFNSAGVEISSQEVELTVAAPLLRFSADTYELTPDGTAVGGSLYYAQADGSVFTSAQKALFDLDLVKELLFPSNRLPLLNDSPYLEASFIERTDQQLKDLRLYLQIKVARLYYRNQELDWTEGQVIDQILYGAALSTGIADATADVAVTNPFTSLKGTCLGVVENNLPLYNAFRGLPSDYLSRKGIQASRALSITSYRGGSTFSVNDSSVSLEIELPVKISVPVVMDSPAEFDISCEGKVLTLTAADSPSSYQAGRYTLYAHVRHSETGELSSTVEAGYLEIYLIGGAAPCMQYSTGSYHAGGIMVPDEIGALASGKVLFGENTDYTSLAVSMQGLYLAQSNSSYNIYYQYDDVDEHGVERYAENGEYAYLNKYQILRAGQPAGSEAMEFCFGYIFLDDYHEHDILSAVSECESMLHPVISGCQSKGSLYHFQGTSSTDSEGYSYCAFADLFGGGGVFKNDFFLEIEG